MKCFLFFLCFLFSQIGICQDWIRYYGYGSQGEGTYCIEQYDHGFILLGDINNYLYNWIVKTDINGNQLWDLKIGDGIHQTMPMSIEQTKDMGFIFCGSSYMFNPPHTDPFIMKLNSCGELEWCRGLVYDNAGDGGRSAKQTSDGGYVLLGGFYGNLPNDRVRLFKFDSAGGLQWYKIYNRDSIIYNEEGHSVIVDSTSILITGECDYENWVRPYFIQTDTAGNENWRLVYSQHTGLGFVGDAYASEKDHHGNYYSAGRRSSTPALLKFSSSGYELMNSDLFPTAIAGGSRGICLYRDTNFIMSAGWKFNSNENYIGLVKTDTMGSVRKTIILPLDADNTISFNVEKTFDDKLISIFSNYFNTSLRMVFVKVNSNLEYDSIYTRHFTYDSLCPHPIVSDTIVPGCGIVGIDEALKYPETAALKVYPNPASGRITVEFPKHLVIMNGNSSFGSTTVYEKWKSTILEVYDLSGKNVFQKEIIRAETSLEMNISGWHPGMYFFRLLYKGTLVAGEKVQVSRN